MGTTTETKEEWKVLGWSVAGLFMFYVAHDALQERAFRTEGFRFGWWMTLNELVVVSTLAFCLEFGAGSKDASTKVPSVAPSKNEHPDSPRVRKMLLLLAVALTVSQGAGSAALSYVHYPVKVAFKSSKLLPTMVLGTLMTGARYGPAEYGAAVLLGCALATLSFAESRASDDAKQSHELALGCFLLTAAVCSDALVPNVQEKILKELKLPVGRMIVWSNYASVVFVFAYVAVTGEFNRALHWSLQHPDAAGFLIAQSFCSYLGLRCYLFVVKRLSGVAGVVVTTFRKVLTIVLSYLLYRKPFTLPHLQAFLLLGAGVALAAYGKTHKGGGLTTKGFKPIKGAPGDDDPLLSSTTASSSSTAGGIDSALPRR